MLKSALIAKLSQKKKKTSRDALNPQSKEKSFLSTERHEKRENTRKKKQISPIEPSKSTKHETKEDLPTNDDFDEEIRELGEKFCINPTQVKKGMQGLISFTLENPKLKNRLFEDDHFPIFLQINAIKVPKGHSRIVRIPLKNSILTPDSEVCLIVADVKGIPNKEHDRHLEYYEKLLHQKGVENIKKIMTFHEFRTEYETFELRGKLVELYDAFLVDGKISGKTVRKCGKIFYKKRKIPTAVKLRATKLKEHIEQTLRKTPLYLHAKGDSFTIQIGHSKMGIDGLVENVFYVVKGLEGEFPGGFGNIRSLNLFAYRGIMIPIYTTLKNQNEVDVVENVRRSQPVEEVSGELTTKLNSGVLVKSTGEVSVFNLKTNDKKQQRHDGNAKENLAKKQKQKRKQLNEDSSTPRKKIKMVEGESKPRKNNKTTKDSKKKISLKN